jgi:nitrite reductase (NADH) small subunit
MTTGAAPEEWQPVCRLAELEIGRGATALAHGQAVAIFRVDDDTVYALGNHDPFARGGGGLAKGIVAQRGDTWFVGSPAHRHAFDLRTGQCLEDGHVSVPAYAVLVAGGMVHIGHRKVHAA